MANKNKKIKLPLSSKGNRCFLWGAFLTLGAFAVGVLVSPEAFAVKAEGKMNEGKTTQQGLPGTGKKGWEAQRDLYFSLLQREPVVQIVNAWKYAWPDMTLEERQQLFSLLGGGVEKWLTPEDIDYADPTFSKQAKKELSKLVHGFFLRAHGCLSREERKTILDSVGDLAMQVHRRKAGL